MASSSNNNVAPITTKLLDTYFANHQNPCGQQTRRDGGQKEEK